MQPPCSSPPDKLLPPKTFTSSWDSAGSAAGRTPVRYSRAVHCSTRLSRSGGRRLGGEWDRDLALLPAGP